MKFMFATVLVTASFLLQACSERSAERGDLETADKFGIAGGQSVADDDILAASTVALRLKNEGRMIPICTGTLISDSIILTAAHCVDTMEGKNLSDEMDVAFDSDANSQESARAEIAKILIHPAYQSIDDRNQQFIQKCDFANCEEDYDKTGHFDLALILLASPAPAKKIPTRLNLDFNKQSFKGTILGYGQQNPQYPVGEKVFGTLKTLDIEAKLSTHKTFIEVISKKGQGACPGDSGGPLFVNENGQWSQIGVTGHAAIAVENEDYACYAKTVNYTGLSKAKDWLLNAKQNISDQKVTFKGPAKAKIQAEKSQGQKILNSTRWLGQRLDKIKATCKSANGKIRSSVEFVSSSWSSKKLEIVGSIRSSVFAEGKNVSFKPDPDHPKDVGGSIFLEQDYRAAISAQEAKKSDIEILKALLGTKPSVTLGASVDSTIISVDETYFELVTKSRDTLVYRSALGPATYSRYIPLTEDHPDSGSFSDSAIQLQCEISFKLK
ncbi:hypothetical protein AZI86_12405 [Bdellovibrio bacteriovorus]|uniref:Peptidase S1 domain-containing protein n=1 Tax=Bdellovibrio bacteriovorus TaxID=959 RepID=A0A150WIL1_BDEBC|nr:trypsin-like serine protease [Bdellovibrio bacteriovorus]KYG63627.1 hypothetical protein AZI86_12405 [Bdellovibrio bacteriovorus]